MQPRNEYGGGSEQRGELFRGLRTAFGKLPEQAQNSIIMRVTQIAESGKKGVEAADVARQMVEFYGLLADMLSNPEVSIEDVLNQLKEIKPNPGKLSDLANRDAGAIQHGRDRTHVIH